MADLQAEGRAEAEGRVERRARSRPSRRSTAARPGRSCAPRSAWGGDHRRGAAEACIEALDRYGKAVGLAFQIVDDLLDVQGDEAKLGKRVGKDSELGKWTYPRFLGVDGSRRRARQLADEAVAALSRSVRAATHCETWRWLFWKGIVDEPA